MQRRLVAAVVVESLAAVEVEAAKRDAASPELDRKIDRLKTAVPSPADFAGLAKKESIVPGDTEDLVDAPRWLRARAAVLADLQSSESPASSPLPPELEVSAVEGVTPRDRLE